MDQIFDNLTNWSSYQLIFLQNLIDKVNSELSNQELEIHDLQKIVADFFVDEEYSYEISEFKNKLIHFLGDKNESVNYLISKLNDYESRYVASTFLGWFGNDASKAVPALMDLAGGHGSAAGSSQRSLLLIGEIESQLLHNIDKSLALEDDEVFGNLSNLAMKTNLVDSKDFFNLLQIGSKHKNPHFRERVVDIIWKFESNQSEIILILERLCSDEETFVRNAAN